jgi:NDP-sugar pyrophosphorylase family protein
MRKTGLLPAAGLGLRTGLSFPKELINIKNKALIEYSVDLLKDAKITDIAVVLRKGKELIADYLQLRYQHLVNLEIVFQPPPFDALIAPIKAALPLLSGSRVHLLMPDTVISPNPFLDCNQLEGLFLHCFRAENDMWRNFGVVSHGMVIEKPDKFVSDLCWGAASWDDAFSRHLQKHTDFPEAMNSFGFNHAVDIKTYKDYGLEPADFEMINLSP